ncbi:Serine hydrolase FSH [Quillaja saponaria]|uniref:Serine hydrolase FSH n=1 Tax=Quillaja saponaria TaxID=32244 RepID=A0AAD7VDP6_QUISA|nr:Serine hydrolase FSH [Quillaja saponaria]
MEEARGQKMKILCLHGFRTSGSFMKKQISKWNPSVLTQFDMEFPNGLYPAGGKSDIEGIFPPPYFEWFQFNKDFTEYINLEECISYLNEYITSKGPFDGLLGFSQGATLSALLLGYQAQGKLLKEHPPFKLFVSISGSKVRDPRICEVVYKDIIKVKSVHFIGEKDWLKIPDEVSTRQLQDWITKIFKHSISDNSHEKEIGDSGEEKVNKPKEAFGTQYQGKNAVEMKTGVPEGGV